MREHYTVEGTRFDGQVIEVRHNPVPDGGFVLIYADITERKHNEAERGGRSQLHHRGRIEKTASLGQLSAAIAHEIKTPLNFVNNFAGRSVDLLGELKQTAAPGFALLDAGHRGEIDELAATRRQHHRRQQGWPVQRVHDPATTQPVSAHERPVSSQPSRSR